MDEIVRIQVQYKKIKDGFEFQDSLYFTVEEYPTKTREEKEAMKQERFDKHLAIFKNPPAPIEPTKKQLEEVETNLQIQIDEVKVRIAQK
jgi:hypothetical protein